MKLPYATKVYLMHAAIPLAIWIALFISMTAPDGHKTLSWSPEDFSTMFGKPLPEDRTRSCDDEEFSCVEIVGEPVYMSLRPPIGQWQTVSLRVLVESEGAQSLQLGIFQDPVRYLFILGQRIELPASGKIMHEATFSLENVLTEQGAYKILFSLPEQKTQGESLRLYSVEATFSRSTPYTDELSHRMKELMPKFFLQ